MLLLPQPIETIQQKSINDKSGRRAYWVINSVERAALSSLHDETFDISNQPTLFPVNRLYKKFTLNSFSCLTNSYL